MRKISQIHHIYSLPRGKRGSLHRNRLARSAQKSSLLVGFGVAVAAAPVVGVLLLGDVVHEVNVGHDADDHLPGLDILLRCV